jgi:hypothetical protein
MAPAHTAPMITSPAPAAITWTPGSTVKDQVVLRQRSGDPGTSRITRNMTLRSCP